ncbi:hypothetical protein RM545_08200 [Zunongwangia sp. F260]|uniref:Uncharacterized protein n=1 Tax=Autumnicola lenta TaxID=3075593 RepID=A0ABU3CJY4_9FLAO|nr:hypothetical protein [Zunongwangia sp. F260]MDT0646669.1 hypothetical protein [Zunongwangia sp. F260]
MEIRKKLIKEIQLSNNEELLEELYHFLHRENKTEAVINLSREQQFAIEKSLNQVRHGQYLTNEEANEEIERWLNG